MARVKAAKRRACEGSLDARHRSRTISVRSVGRSRHLPAARAAPVHLPIRADRRRSRAVHWLLPRTRIRIREFRLEPLDFGIGFCVRSAATAAFFRVIDRSSTGAKLTIPVSGKWYSQLGVSNLSRSKTNASTGLSQRVGDPDGAHGEPNVTAVLVAREGPVRESTSAWK